MREWNFLIIIGVRIGYSINGDNTIYIYNNSSYDQLRIQVWYIY